MFQALISLDFEYFMPRCSDDTQCTGSHDAGVLTLFSRGTETQSNGNIVIVCQDIVNYRFMVKVTAKNQGWELRGPSGDIESILSVCHAALYSVSR